MAALNHKMEKEKQAALQQEEARRTAASENDETVNKMKEQEQEEQAENNGMDSFMEEIRKLGRLPKRNRTASKKEQKLAVGLKNAKRGCHLNDEHKAELAAMKKKEQEVQAEKNGKKSLMGDIGEFGRMQKKIKTAAN